MNKLIKFCLIIAGIEIIAVISIMIYSNHITVNANENNPTKQEVINDITIPTADELKGQVSETDIIPDGKGGYPLDTLEPTIQENQNFDIDKQIIDEKPVDQPIHSNDGHSRWNNEKQCWDESNFSYQFIDVPYNNSGSYDPNWLVCDKMNNGCLFCFHPNQGHENGPVDSKE